MVFTLKQVFPDNYFIIELVNSDSNKERIAKGFQCGIEAHVSAPTLQARDAHFRLSLYFLR